jgi:hypothetical protein
MSESERQQMLVCAEMLALGQTLTRVARVGFACMLALGGAHMWNYPPAPGQFELGLTLWLAFFVWATGEWVASRVRLDRRLFGLMAQDRCGPEDLDRVLGRYGRPVQSRTSGALGLLRKQGLLVGLLMALLLVLVAVVEFL